MLQSYQFYNNCIFNFLGDEEMFIFADTVFEYTKSLDETRVEESLPNLEVAELIKQCQNNDEKWPPLHWAIAQLHRPDVALEILRLFPEQVNEQTPPLTKEEMIS